MITVQVTPDFVKKILDVDWDQKAVVIDGIQFVPTMAGWWDEKCWKYNPKYRLFDEDVYYRPEKLADWWKWSGSMKKGCVREQDVFETILSLK